MNIQDQDVLIFYGLIRLHELKCWPEYFELVTLGLKPFEYRQNDRGYEVNDILRLKEYDPATQSYSGRMIDMDVTCVIDDCPGLPEGYCIMGISKR